VSKDPATAAAALAIAAVPAIAAPAAGADARDQYPVAGSDVLHTGTDLRHSTDRLVAEDPTIRDRRHIPLENVQIGTADGHGIDLYDRIGVVVDRRFGDLLPVLTARSVVDERTHTSSPPCSNLHARRFPVSPTRPQGHKSRN
jgi:hypothetical protein